MIRSTWVMLAILLLALGLRLVQISQISLRADEAANVFLAMESPADIIRPFITEDPHLPLYHILLHFWMEVAGRSELAVRFLTVTAGVVTVALTYTLGRLAFPTRRGIAVTGAFLAAINPYSIWDAQDAHLYALLTTTTLFSLVTFWRALRPGAQLPVWVGYILASAVGLFLHYFAVLALLAQAVVWLFWTVRRTISREATRAWLIAIAIVGALFVPWLVLVLPFLSGLKLAFFPPVTWLEMLQRSIVAASVGRMDGQMMAPMVEPVTGTLLGIAFLILLMLGLWVRDPADRRGRTLLAFYLAIPLVAIYAFSVWKFPVYDERYILFLAPAFLVIVARGMFQLVESFPRLVPTVALVVVLLGSAHSLYNYFYVPEFAKSPDWHSFTRVLLAQAQPGDILVQNYPDPALPYYLDNRLPRVLLPRTGTSTAADVDADLNRLASKYSRIWLQPVPNAEWDYDGLVATWLDRHALQMRTYAFQGLKLMLYSPAAVATRQAEAVDATFSGNVRLLAFAFDPREPQPGTTLNLVLYWQALAPVQADATVFVHLYAADGRLVSQQDNAPVHNTYPSSQWQVGETVVDSYTLPLAGDLAEGEYALVVGMYDTQTLARWTVTHSTGQLWAENRVLLTNLRIARPEGGR